MYGFIVSVRLNGAEWKGHPVVASCDEHAVDLTLEAFAKAIEAGVKVEVGGLTLFTLKAATISRNKQKFVALVAIREGFIFYSEVSGMVNHADFVNNSKIVGDVIFAQSGPTHYEIKFDNVVVPLKKLARRIPARLAA
jgi:hypothetical protein